MQTNPMKTALAEGKVQIGTWLNLMRNPAILTLMKSAGLDYARVDMEHSSPSIETVADMAVLGRAISAAAKMALGLVIAVAGLFAALRA